MYCALFLLFSIKLLSCYSLVFYDSIPCSSCKWFVPNSKDFIKNDDYGLCKLFKNNYNVNGNKLVIYEYAKHCRKNENMCGQEGHLYEKTDEYDLDLDREKQEELLEHILDEYDELSNRGWGEVNENSEIEEIEQDFINLFMKIKQLLKDNR
jgi:hypothetical protein